MTVVLEAKDLNAFKVNTQNDKYEKIQIINNLSFKVDEGDIFTIMGSSGSGKTTLLRLINRLEDPDSGQIFLEGKNIRDFPILELRRQIGFVLQLPYMFEGSVRDNIFYGPRLQGQPDEETQKILEQYFSWFGFKKGILEKSPSFLSVGEKQRVSILRALVNKPALLLLDEPTSSLDPNTANSILGLVKEINERTRMTILMVTHIPEHARKIAGKGMILDEGSKIADGTMDEISGYFNKMKQKNINQENSQIEVYNEDISDPDTRNA
ncbi:MAG: ATP-binding cassette domain-containing protein [Vulcanimicrobiota bacterium]